MSIIKPFDGTRFRMSTRHEGVLVRGWRGGEVDRFNLEIEVHGFSITTVSGIALTREQVGEVANAVRMARDVCTYNLAKVDWADSYPADGRVRLTEFRARRFEMVGNRGETWELVPDTRGVTRGNATSLATLYTMNIGGRSQDGEYSLSSAPMDLEHLAHLAVALKRVEKAWKVME